MLGRSNVDNLHFANEQIAALSKSEWFEPRDFYASLQQLVKTCEKRVIEFEEAERTVQGSTAIAVPSLEPQPVTFATAIDRVAKFLKALQGEFEKVGINQVPFFQDSAFHQFHQLTLIQRKLLEVENNPVIRKLKQLFDDIEATARPIIDSRKKKLITDHHLVAKDRLGAFVNEAEFCSSAMGQRAGVGGHDTISLLLNNEPNGSTFCGAIIDALFLGAPVADAHRGRKRDLTAMIRIVLNCDQGEGSFELSSIACGPAREITEFIENSTGNPALSRLHVALVDYNPGALNSAIGTLESGGMATRRRLQHQTGPTYLEKQLDIAELLSHYSSGMPRERPGWLLHPLLADQVNCTSNSGPRPRSNFTEAAGIIDYQSDEMATTFGTALFDETVDGGLVVMTSVDPSNPDRGVQGALLKWVLITRDKEKMKQLAERIGTQLEQARTSAIESGNTREDLPRFDAKFRDDISSVGSLLSALNTAHSDALLPGEYAVVSGQNGLNWYLVMRKNLGQAAATGSQKS